MDEYSEFQMAVATPPMSSSNTMEVNKRQDFWRFDSKNVHAAGLGSPSSGFIGSSPVLRAPPSSFQKASPIVGPSPGSLLPLSGSVSTTEEQTPAGVGSRLANYNLGMKKQQNDLGLKSQMTPPPPQRPFQSSGSLPSQSTSTTIVNQSLLIGEEDKYAALRALVEVDNEIQPPVCDTRTTFSTPSVTVIKDTRNENSAKSTNLNPGDDDFSEFGDFQSFANPSNNNSLIEPESKRDNYFSNNSTNNGNSSCFEEFNCGNGGSATSISSNISNGKIMSLLDLDDFIVPAPSPTLKSKDMSNSISKKESQTVEELNEIWIMPMTTTLTTLTNGSDTSSIPSSSGNSGDLRPFASFNQNAPPRNQLINPSVTNGTMDSVSPNKFSRIYESSSIFPTSRSPTTRQDDVNITEPPVSPFLSAVEQPDLNLSNLDYSTIGSTGVKLENDILEYIPFDSINKSDISPETRSIASLDLGNCYSTTEVVDQKNSFVPDNWSNIPHLSEEVSESFDLCEIRKDEERVVDAAFSDSTFFEPEPERKTHHDVSSSCPSLEQMHNGVRCLTSIKKIFKDAITLFSQASNNDVLSEVTCCQKGKTYVTCLLEVYKVFCRLQFSCQEHVANGGNMETLFDEIQNVWTSLVTYLGETNTMNKLTLDELTKQDDCQRNCGLCLTTVDTTNLGSFVDKDGVLFHLQCANLWVNNVETCLPCSMQTRIEDFNKSSGNL